jgi:hypothetical protein
MVRNSHAVGKTLIRAFTTVFLVFISKAKLQAGGLSTTTACLLMERSLNELQQHGGVLNLASERVQLGFQWTDFVLGPMLTGFGSASTKPLLPHCNGYIGFENSIFLHLIMSDRNRQDFLFTSSLHGAHSSAKSKTHSWPI